jgi:hypothetical protein
VIGQDLRHRVHDELLELFQRQMETGAAEGR